MALPFLLPGFVLSLRALTDYNVLYSSAVVWFSVGFGALLVLAARTVDSAARKWKRRSLSSLFVWATATEFPSRRTRCSIARQGQSYIARVEDKRLVKGRNPAYELVLGPWGPKATSNKLRVSRATYLPIHSGDLVNLTFKPGALGLPWYFMRAWQRGNNASQSPR